MTSILKVSEIQDPTNSNTALSIDSSGRVIMPQKPHVNVDFGGTGAYLSHSANDVVKFDTVYAGDASLFNTSTYKFTCPVDGVYMAAIHLLLQTEVNNDIPLYKNGVLQTSNYHSANRRVSAVNMIVCSAGDEIYYVSGPLAYWDGSAAGGGRYSHGSFTLIG